MGFCIPLACQDRARHVGWEVEAIQGGRAERGVLEREGNKAGSTH